MSWILHTLSPSLSAPARHTRTFHLSHHHISVRRHSIIPTLTLKTIIPSQSAMPYHIGHTLNTQKASQILTALSIVQGHSTHPFYHNTFCPLQTFQVLSLHCPDFSLMCQNTLDTRSINLINLETNGNHEKVKNNFLQIFSVHSKNNLDSFGC